MLDRRRHRGMALVTALFFGSLCLALATSFLLQVPVDLVTTSEVRRSTQASYVADAAIQDTMAWISHQLAVNAEPCTETSPRPLRQGTLGPYEWTCLVEPDPGTPPRGLTPLRIYRLTSVVSLDGQDQYRIVTDVQAGQSFSRFSHYIDKKQPAVTSWYDFIISEDSRYSGPIHKNDPISFKVTDALLNQGSPPSTRPFNSLISTSTTSHRWNDVLQPLSKRKYDNVLTNGQADLLFNAPERSLPSSSEGLARAAWGGIDANEDSTLVKVSVRQAGGVFIEGDVDRMELSVDSSNRSVLTIKQGSTITTIVEDTTAGQRLVTNGGATSSVPGIGNGVIFATGDIKSLRGTNKGPHTIATRFDLNHPGNPSRNKSIEISGNLTRADTIIGSEPTGTDDRLGLVTSRIWVADGPALPRGPASPTLYIYAHMTATDSFVVKGYRGPTTPAEYFPSNSLAGGMEIFGGLATRYPWRTMHTSDLNSFTVERGLGSPTRKGSAPIHYDKLLVNDPPPMYPSTAGTELMVRSWREFPR